jgi:hypothetical protein
MSPKILFTVTTLAFFTPIVAIMGYNLRFDRYQYYRRWLGKTPIFSNSQRYQNAGLIRNYPYDTLLLGTSRSDNFTSAMFSRSGWKVLKVSTSGSGSTIQARTLELALHTGKVKRVLWEMSFDGYTLGINHFRDDLTFPEYLYRPTLETPFLYLLSWDLFQEARQVQADRVQHIALEDRNVWQPTHAHKFGKNLYLAKPIHCHLAQLAQQDVNFRDPVTEATINHNLTQFIAQHPEIEFIGFFPPFPQTWLTVVSRPNVQKRLLFRRAVYHLTDVYKNFKIYDFALWEEVTTDPTLYKDFTHYHQDINRRMAEIMSTGQPFRATNGTEANELLLEISKRFDWKSIQCYPARRMAP